MIKKIMLENELVALFISGDHNFNESHFFTDDTQPIQLGVFAHDSGHEIPLHKHNTVFRVVPFTQEVIFCRQGELLCTLYPSTKDTSYELILKAGDILYLINGWHKFEVGKDCVFLEVKNGPYLGAIDKTREC